MKLAMVLDVIVNILCLLIHSKHFEQWTLQLSLFDRVHSPQLGTKKNEESKKNAQHGDRSTRLNWVNCMQKRSSAQKNPL